MNAPTITLNGKAYTAPAPKMKLWRAALKFHQMFENSSPTEQLAFEEMENLIVTAFNNPGVSAQALEEELELEDFIALFQSITTWITEIVNDKVTQLPNAQTLAE